MDQRPRAPPASAAAVPPADQPLHPQRGCFSASGLVLVRSSLYLYYLVVSFCVSFQLLFAHRTVCLTYFADLESLGFSPSALSLDGAFVPGRSRRPWRPVVGTPVTSSASRHRYGTLCVRSRVRAASWLPRSSLLRVLSKQGLRACRAQSGCSAGERGAASRWERAQDSGSWVSSHPN